MRRSLSLATAGCVLVLLFAAPVPALGDPDPTTEGDACRDAGGSALLCAGVDQLSNATSAWCREYLTCTQPSTDTVDPWVASSLADQRALGDPLPLRESFWFGTHNSYNSPTYGFSVSRNDPNQRYGLTDQLRIGARFLELDVHWFAGRPVVCHARPASEAHAGCSIEQTIDVFVDELAGWLDTNPDEVIALRIEDALVDDANRAATGDVIRSHLGADRLYWPDGSDPCAPWPAEVSRADIRATGAQVLLVTDDCGTDGDGLGPGAWRYVRDEGGSRDDCALPTFVRAFEDATWVGAATGGGRRFSADDVAAMLPCVNQLDLDMLDPEDERLPALVWSWAPGQPDGTGCAVTDGRFRTAPCTAIHRFACQDGDGSWAVTRTRGRWGRGADACRVERLGQFDPPRSAREHAALTAVAVGDVWIGLARR